MSREFGQGRFKLEACVDVVSVVPGVDESSLDHAELHSHILKGWRLQLRQGIGDALHSGLATKRDA